MADVALDASAFVDRRPANGRQRPSRAGALADDTMMRLPGRVADAVVA
jgi:hypothetical protein